MCLTCCDCCDLDRRLQDNVVRAEVRVYIDFFLSHSTIFIHGHAGQA